MNISEKIICPLCSDAVDKLLYRFHIDNERVVMEKIKKEHPSWALSDGLCSRCRDYYYVEIVMEQRLLPAIGPYFPIKSADDFVILPVALRIDADPRFTGKGITICFIDSGFCAHPDLTSSGNRIKKYIDITSNAQESITGKKAESSCWHGTMTSVVCAGDGYLSKGLYKGIASDAELVLIKAQNSEGKITTESIENALKWVLQNHEQYKIRIVNLSLSADEIISYKESKVDQLAEALIEKGIAIVAAVGNDEFGAIHPPANALNVIAVGGVDDENILSNEKKAYHSSYGMTIDELMKPELVAHAIWIAAPILPGTEEEEEAGILHQLLSFQNENFERELRRCLSKTKLDHHILQETDIGRKKEAIISRMQSAKYISPHYMHVDGTSFAAPIVSSVIAQLLEADPDLTPMHIRHLLFSTAKRIPGIPPERQGYGMVHPRKSLFRILKRVSIMNIPKCPFINQEKQIIEFLIYNDSAAQISLAGSFNNWAKDVLLLEPGKNGLWKIEIQMLPAGRYHYKFYLDEKTWMEDVENPYREPDGFSGFNSVLTIEP